MDGNDNPRISAEKDGRETSCVWILTIRLIGYMMPGVAHLFVANLAIFVSKLRLDASIPDKNRGDEKIETKMPEPS